MTTVYTVRRIDYRELRRRGLHTGDRGVARSGWAVVSLEGDEERVIDWFADQHVARAVLADLDAEALAHA